MNTASAHRVKAGAAVNYQVIKCTVAGPIIDIVIIAIVIVVIIKWLLRCIDFCGFCVDDTLAETRPKSPKLALTRSNSSNLA